MPCEQFLNFFILYFYEGRGQLEKSQTFKHEDLNHSS